MSFRFSFALKPDRMLHLPPGDICRTSCNAVYFFEQHARQLPGDADLMR